MAQQASAGHKLGQLIGDWWEEFVVLPLLREVAAELGLFLDSRFVDRPGRSGDKIIWADEEGNHVDYDFVMELHGTPQERGVPVAFVEVFWRRGARHSKDKSRDDSGKLLPMRDTYPTARFLGIAASGQFTNPAKTLIRSREIDLFYVPKDRIIRAFKHHGLIMDYPDRLGESEKAVLAVEFERQLTAEAKRNVAQALFEDLGKAAIEAYASRIRAALSAKPLEIRFIETTHSEAASFESLAEAADFLENPEFSYNDAETTYRYEVSYSDGYEFVREVASLSGLKELNDQLTELANHMELLAERRDDAS